MAPNPQMLPLRWGKPQACFSWRLSSYSRAFVSQLNGRCLKLDHLAVVKSGTVSGTKPRTVMWQSVKFRYSPTPNGTHPPTNHLCSVAPRLSCSSRDPASTRRPPAPSNSPTTSQCRWPTRSGRPTPRTTGSSRVGGCWPRDSRMSCTSPCYLVSSCNHRLGYIRCTYC